MNNVLISLILGLTFLIYSPALHHEFVNLDDAAHVSENPQVRSVSLQNIKRIFSSLVQRTYIPLTTLSFALEYQIVGKNPFLYHLDNVLLHGLVVFLVFRLGIGLGLQALGAAVAAFIFALHPMHVESVAWVTERKDVLYSVFYLGAVLWYLRFLKSGKWRDYSFALLMGFLSILAKPMALSLPLILLLCDWFYKGTLKKEDWLNKIPFGLFIIPVAWMTFSINAGIVGQNPGPGFLLRFWTTAFYLKKFFWPVLCVPHYLPPLPINIFHFEYVASVGIVALSLFAFFKWRNRFLRLAFLWYFLSIFFILNFDYGRVMQMVADRYMYLPSVGFCLWAGAGVQRWRETKFFSSFTGKSVFFAALVGIALFLTVKTFYQVGIWKNSLVLWNYTIKHSPTSYLAFNNRGRIYESQRQWNLALADYKQSIALNSQYEKAYKNLGMVYENLGDIPSAIEAYSKAIEVKPNYSGAYNNRGLLFEKKGDNALALADYTRAIEGERHYLLGYINRGALFLKLGEIEKALEDFNSVIFLKPDYFEAYKNRAVCYLQMNLLDEASHDCQKALQLNRSDANLHTICSAIAQKRDAQNTAFRLGPVPE